MFHVCNLFDIFTAGRSPISLGHILQFSTGSTAEPVLDFTIKPTLEFVPTEQTFPSASTCVNNAGVAQLIERRAQRSDDPCVGGSNPTVGRGCRSFG
jgi:hypothetical protein